MSTSNAEQRLPFAEITEKAVRPVGRDTLDPILFLLTSLDTEVQWAVSAALCDLTVKQWVYIGPLSYLRLVTQDWLRISGSLLKLGALEPLVCQSDA